MRLSERTYLIDAEAFGSRELVALYLISGERLVLVDAGAANWAHTILGSISKSGLDVSDISDIILTHIHLDHAGASGFLANKLPKARVWVHERGARHIVNPEKLMASATKVFGEEGIAHYGPMINVQESRVKIAYDGATLDIGSGVRLKLISAPGHAPHELCILNESTGELFVGDSFGYYFPSVPFLMPAASPPDFDLEAMIQTIRRLQDLNPDRLMLPHFGPLDEAARTLREATESLKLWRDMVAESVARGEGRQEIFRNMVQFVAESSNTPVERMHEFIK